MASGAWVTIMASKIGVYLGDRIQIVLLFHSFQWLIFAPTALSNYYGSRSYYPGLVDDDLVGDEDVVAAEPRVVIPKNNNKRGSTVIRLIKRNDQEPEEDNF